MSPLTSSRVQVRRTVGVFLTLVLVTAAPFVGAVAPASPSSEFVPGEVLVRFDIGAAPDALDRDQLEGVVESRVVSEQLNIWVLDAPGVQVEEMVARLSSSPRVAYAEPNYLITRTVDPNYPLQWGLRNAWHGHAFFRTVPDMDVNAPEAWQVTTGDPAIVVAVIDTGVQIGHPDLDANIWTNTAEVGGAPGVDDDGNGYPDDVNGWDFVNGDSSVYDSESEDAHGTHVAGIVAAAHNGLGGIGVAPSTTVMPLKFLPGEEGGTVEHAVEAIEYASDMGADVINASWTALDFSSSLYDAIEASGLPFIAAAGNSGRDADTSPEYPAAFDLPNVLSVAAIDPSGDLAAFSNFGDQTVDVGAPGATILSTVPTDAYAYEGGTSMAAPHVSGVAALRLAQAPTATTEDLIQHLVQTGRPIASLQGMTVSGKLIDAAGAVGGTRLSIGTGPRGSGMSTTSNLDVQDIGTSDRSSGRWGSG